MDDLPELPFEKVLSYLSLKDRLKARAVSRRWYHKINSFRVKTLCYSERPSGFIKRKNLWVSGAFAKNFIWSSRSASFFDTFGKTILSKLKNLRLCDLELNDVNATALAQALNSFGQLQELGLFSFYGFWTDPPYQVDEFELNLPMLTSLQLESVCVIRKLTLNAPSLQKVQLTGCGDLRLVIVHGESVKRLLTDRPEYTAVKNLKKLEVLYIKRSFDIDPTFLSNLDQLKEIHLYEVHRHGTLENLFEQAQRYDRADLKIYYCGYLLDGPDDAAIHSLYSGYMYDIDKKVIVQLTENQSKLADQIPFFGTVYYSAIESVDREVAIDILTRATGFGFTIHVDRPVQDIERFLNLLKTFDNITHLSFACDQPQDLFDRLPEYITVPSLYINFTTLDFRFLSRLEHIISLEIYSSIDLEIVREVLELKYLTWFRFMNSQRVEIEVTRHSRWTHPKCLKVAFVPEWEWSTVPDVNAAIELIVASNQREPPINWDS